LVIDRSYYVGTMPDYTREQTLERSEVHNFTPSRRVIYWNIWILNWRSTCNDIFSLNKINSSGWNCYIQFSIKKLPIVTFDVFFNLYQRPSSVEAGTSSSGFCHDETTLYQDCGRMHQQRDWVTGLLPEVDVGLHSALTNHATEENHMINIIGLVRWQWSTDRARSIYEMD